MLDKKSSEDEFGQSLSADEVGVSAVSWYHAQCGELQIIEPVPTGPPLGKVALCVSACVWAIGAAAEAPVPHSPGLSILSSQSHAAQESWVIGFLSGAL